MNTDAFRQTIELLETWLRIDSTSGNEAAFLAALEAYFSELGYYCERLAVAPDRWNLRVTLSEPPRFLFSTHVDTVPPVFGSRRAGGGFLGGTNFDYTNSDNTTEDENQERIDARSAC